MPKIGAWGDSDGRGAFGQAGVGQYTKADIAKAAWGAGNGGQEAGWGDIPGATLIGVEGFVGCTKANVGGRGKADTALRYADVRNAIHLGETDDRSGLDDVSAGIQV